MNGLVHLAGDPCDMSVLLWLIELATSRLFNRPQAGAAVTSYM